MIGTIGNKVPFRYRQLAQLLDGSPCRDHAEIAPERVEGSDIGVENGIDGAGMERAQMVSFEEGVDDELPIDAPLKHARLIVAI